MCTSHRKCAARRPCFAPMDVIEMQKKKETCGDVFSCLFFPSWLKALSVQHSVIHLHLWSLHSSYAILYLSQITHARWLWDSASRATCREWNEYKRALNEWGKKRWPVRQAEQNEVWRADWNLNKKNVWDRTDETVPIAAPSMLVVKWLSGNCWVI